MSARRKSANLFAVAAATAAALLLPSVRLLADPPAAPVPPSALSPAIQDAIDNFRSGDATTRAAAFQKLQLALAQQLRTVTNSDDPEVLSRLAEALQSDDGLTRWVIDTLKLPPEERNARLEFGLQPEASPAIALAFSSDPQKRVAGIRALAKIDNPQATAILANAINDPDRAVYLAAMEAVWDKKPIDPVVAALWNRAVGDASIPNQSDAPEQPVTFRGKPVAGPFTSAGLTGRKLDGNIARDVLIHINAPAVPEKIITYLENFDKANDPRNAAADSKKNASGGPGASGMIPVHGINGRLVVPLVYNPMGEPFRNVLTLAESCKSKATFPILYKLAANPLRRKVQNLNGKDKFFYSNRTEPLAVLVIASGQKTDDYQLHKLSTMNAAWAFSSPDDETAAIKKLHDWYAANIDKNVPDPAAGTIDTPASQPDKDPVAPVAPAPPQMPEPPAQK